MKQAQIDYLNWRYALKSNLVKGAHTLRSILADNAQARMFAENPAAVAVVLSYDKENPDGNAEELYELLTNSSVAETASLTYICNTYGVSNFGELFADEEKMAALLEDESSMNAIAASETAMASLAYNADAMANIAASETAMGSINASVTASRVVAGSSIALNAIAASDTAMTIVADNATIMNAMVADSTAVAAFAASSASMAAVAASEPVMVAIVANEAAMNTVAASGAARSAISASSVAIDCIDDSDSATAKILAGEAGLNPSSYSATSSVISSGMSAIAARSSAMSLAAKLPIALREICKSGDARTAFIKSSYRDTYYSDIIATLDNAEYFTAAIKNGSYVSAYNYTYFYNALYPDGMSGGCVADACWAIIHSVSSFEGGDVGYVSDIQTGTVSLTGTYANPTYPNAVLPGGFTAGNAVNNTCSLYIPVQ